MQTCYGAFTITDLSIRVHATIAYESQVVHSLPAVVDTHLGLPVEDGPIISCSLFHTQGNKDNYKRYIVTHYASRIFTFCVSRRRRKMYCGHARLCVCLSAAVRPHYCMDPDVT